MKQQDTFTVLRLSTWMVTFTFLAAARKLLIIKEQSANWTRQLLFGAKRAPWTRGEMVTMSFLMAPTFWSLAAAAMAAAAMEITRRRGAHWSMIKWRVPTKTRHWLTIISTPNCSWSRLTSVNFKEQIKLLPEQNYLFLRIFNVFPTGFSNQFLLSWNKLSASGWSHESFGFLSLKESFYKLCIPFLSSN